MGKRLPTSRPQFPFLTRSWVKPIHLNLGKGGADGVRAFDSSCGQRIRLRVRCTLSLQPASGAFPQRPESRPREDTDQPQVTQPEGGADLWSPAHLLGW